MADDGMSEPTLRNSKGQSLEKVGTKLLDQAQKLQDKAGDKFPGIKTESEKKEPAGGFDATKFPQAPPGYTIKITFHRAENLPFADINTLSSDPYIMAVLKTRLEKRHKQDPELRRRTPTIHRNTNPEWNTEWIIANVPASGFHLKCRLYDEDPADHDDRLGNAHVLVESINDSWEGIKDGKFGIKKRMGSKRAYTLRGAAALFSRRIKMDGFVVVSVENLGRTKDDNGGHMYTMGPLPWCRHYSPLIGRIAGTKETSDDDDGEKKKGPQKYNFQAVQMQLQGPVPEDLYHRYVEFKPFVNGMFNAHSVRGKILNRALHHQHARVYNYDQTTKYGVFQEPCKEMTQKFLELVDWDRGGKIFTYVLTLDGLLRFTQTGKEFGIDLLSKHSMHSNVSIYIAFSGEFFLRRLKHPNRYKDSTPNPSEDFLPPAPESNEGQEEGLAEGAPSQDKQSKSKNESKAKPAKPEEEQSSKPPKLDRDPGSYHLVIDNDSGTYRPNAEKLSLLKKYLEYNLPGLKVSTLDCQQDADKMKHLKDQQRGFKKSSGTYMTYLQNSSQSSISSSEEEVLDERAHERPHEHKYKKEMHKLQRHHHSGESEGKRGRQHSGYGDGTSSSSEDESPDHHQKSTPQSKHGMKEGETALPMLNGNPKSHTSDHATNGQVQNQEMVDTPPRRFY